MKTCTRLLFAWVLSLWVFAPVSAEHHKPHTPVVMVVGSGIVAGTPDRVEFQVGVTSRNLRAARALEENSNIVKLLQKVLSEHGVESQQVQTVRFDVSPEYDHRNNQPPPLIGYRVNHMLSVTHDDISTAGVLLDALVATEASELQAVRFSVADPSPLLEQARALAVADARARAETLAETAGLRLGPVRRITEDVNNPAQPMMEMSMRTLADSAVPIAHGEQDFSVQVTVVFELLQP